MKFTKKFIAVLLSVLFVVSMSPISALAATVNNLSDPSITAIEDAIQTYENKMDGTTIYTNMTPAYNAYILANAARDAYVYGDKNIDLSQYTSSLTTATNNMQKYVNPNNANRIPVFNSYMETSGSISSLNEDRGVDGNHSNVLWNSNIWADDDNVRFDKYTDSTSTYTQLKAMGIRNVVLMYDGKNNASFPIIIQQTQAQRSGVTQYIAYDYVATTGTTDWTLGTNQIFYDTSNWNIFKPEHTTNNPLTSNKGNNSSAQKNNANNMFNGTYHWQGQIYYNGKGDTTNYYQKFDQIQLTARADLNWSWWSFGTKWGNNFDYELGPFNYQTNKSVYVVNFKPVYDLISSMDTTFVKNAKNYKQGGLQSIFAKYDQLTAFNINTYFSNTNDSTVEANTQNAGNAIKTLVSNVGTLPTKAAFEDVKEYDTLRKAINDTRSTYNSTEYQKYTTESWANFVAAFETAKNTINYVFDNSGGVQSASYVAQVAKTLTDAKDNLQVNFAPADTSKLVQALDDADEAIASKTYFTTKSFNESGLETNVPAVKRAVWGSEAQYKDPASCIDDSQQQVVDDALVTIGEGIAHLEVSTDKTVVSAKGYSMVSALDAAAAINPADYGNYVILQKAIENAQEFNPIVIADTSDNENFEMGIVKAKLTEYVKLVENIVDAIVSLQPAFSKMENGKKAAVGVKGDNTQASFTTNNGGATSTIKWDRDNNVIIFRTTSDPATFDLGPSKFTWSSNKNYDFYLETINFQANEALQQSVELSDLSGGDYSGKLQINANGATYKWNNFVVSGSNTNPIGKDISGNAKNLDSNFVWDSELLQYTNNHANPVSGIIAKNGTTTFTANATLSVPAADKYAELDDTTLPTSTTYTAKATFGALNTWKVTVIGTFDGFSYLVSPYTQTTYVVDVTTLVDLINECKALERRSYTDTSWDNFTAAIAAADTPMDYSTMTAGEIKNECVSRYKKLYNAKEALVEAASNKVIKDAIQAAAQVKSDKDNKVKNYRADTYEAMLAAVEEATEAISTGAYTDKKCLNLVKEDYQAAIDAVAKKVTDAIAALVESANFAKVDAAVATAIESKKFSTSELNDLVSKLNELTYLTMTAEERFNEFDQTAVDAEADVITSYFNALVAVDAIDTDVVEALKADLDSKVSDPDAYEGVANAKAFLDSYLEDDVLYSTVNVFGQSVVGINLTQDDTDAMITEALTKLQAKTYDVFVNGEKIGTYNFGEEVKVEFGAEKVDVYSRYVSKTASSPEKYVTTDFSMMFVVKGDTYIRTQATKSVTNTHRVTVVNELTGKTVAIEFVEDGQQFTVPDAETISGLSVPYYDFVGYTVNEKDVEAGDAITVTADVKISANYEPQGEDAFLFLCYYNTGDGLEMVEGETLYNDKVELSQEGFSHYKKISTSSFEGAQFFINGEDVTVTGKKASAIHYKDSDSDDIYAYALANTEDIDTFDELYQNYIVINDYTGEKSYSEDVADFQGILSVVSYGTDYTTYASGNMILLALTKAEYDDAVAAGLIKADKQGADITTSEAVDSGIKYTIISTYSIPTNAKFIEGGILLTNKGADLKFSNVTNGSGVYRFKSTQKTQGNQYVMSFNKGSKQLNVAYLAYVIYDIDGTQYTVYSDRQTAVFDAMA